MAYDNHIKFKKIVLNYMELGEKKLFKKSLKEISVNKKVFIYYSRRKNIPICALPTIKLILSSRQGFLSFCFNFYNFTDNINTNIPISKSSIKSIAKIVVAHEVGHILDPNLANTKTEYTNILSNIIDKLIEYNVDINDSKFHKKNLPIELDQCVLNLKKNLILRECDAWDIAESILTFENEGEKLIFDKIKEYALATYNYGNIKTIVSDHNLDLFFKYRRYFA